MSDFITNPFIALSLGLLLGNLLTHKETNLTRLMVNVGVIAGVFLEYFILN